MSNYRRQYKVSAVTAGTGITLVPVVGERGANTQPGPNTIELTYTSSPTEYRIVGKVIDVDLDSK